MHKAIQILTLSLSISLISNVAAAQGKLVRFKVLSCKYTAWASEELRYIHSWRDMDLEEKDSAQSIFVDLERRQFGMHTRCLINDTVDILQLEGEKIWSRDTTQILAFSFVRPDKSNAKILLFQSFAKTGDEYFLFYIVDNFAEKISLKKYL